MFDINEKYLEMVMKCPKLRKYGVNEVQIAEMLTIKESSLWYSQVQSWINNPPEIKNEKVKKIFQEESQIFFDSINNDFKIPNKYGKIGFIAVQDFINIIKQLHQNSLMVISQWFFIVGDLILHNSKKLEKDIIKDLPKESRMRKCIAIECEKEVDITKRKSGACCIEHTKYYCKECTCWHHYGTKVAEKHYKYKVTDWIKNKEERLNTIGANR